MKLLCFGDSNTYGYDPRSCFGGCYPAEVRWTDVLAQATGWEVLNAGQNGREIPHRAGELAQADRLLAECGPLDLLTVMLGTNDLLQFPAMTAGGAAERMAAFLRRVLERRPPETVLLIAPPSMRRGAWVAEERLVRTSAALAEGQRLEMLFLSPAVRGRGLGRQLVEWGVRRYGVREVCVNEQNPQALGFYRRMGFCPYSRTELDEQGRPFPLLYLRREDGPCSWD